jgi:hypothetical protein
MSTPALVGCSRASQLALLIGLGGGFFKNQFLSCKSEVKDLKKGPFTLLWC